MVPPATPQRPALAEIDVNSLSSVSARQSAPKPKRGPSRRTLEVIQSIPYKLPAPLKRNRVVASPNKKMQIILYLIYHRIKVVDDGHQLQRRCLPGLEYDGDWRPPTAQEAALHFLMLERTIRKIWTERHNIIQLQRKQKISRSAREGKWGDFEAELARQFIDWRQQGLKVLKSWLWRRARTIFELLSLGETFCFSPGWFNNFCKRWDISFCRLTYQAQKVPEEYTWLVNSFLCFVRRNYFWHFRYLGQYSHKYGYIGDNKEGNSGDWMKYRLSNILNIDEVPIPFEFFDGYTYELKGERTITGSVTNSSWNKR
jgi:hypothetical protein